MQRPFAVFDIDGTLIRWQLYHAVANELLKLGTFDGRDIDAIKATRMNWKKRTENSSFSKYEHELINAYDKQLMTLDVNVFDEIVERVFDEYKDQTYIFTRNLISRLKSSNYLLFAISGSQEEIVQKIADYHGFDGQIGVAYGRDKNSFTGTKDLRALDKKQALENMVEKFKASWQGSIAVGDTIGDMPMLECVEMPIAFNPEAQLFDNAKHEGWKIVIERKNVVYELEGSDGKYILA